MMLPRLEYIKRREALRERMQTTGIVLIAANPLSPMSYLSNTYRFCQDSSFRYMFGVNEPDLFGVLDLDEGSAILFRRTETLDDYIWSGAACDFALTAEQVGISDVRDISLLETYVAKQQVLGRRVHILPPYRAELKIALSQLLDCSITCLAEYHSPELVFAMAHLRESKSEAEIAEIEKAYRVGYEMHTLAMRMAQAGVVEREIVGAIEGVAQSFGDGFSFPSIVSQRGERLHNTSIDGRLEQGRMLLCDAGARSISGYTSDNTRSYPVGGQFSDCQRDIYNVVLGAYDKVASVLRAGVRYEELQRECLKSLGEGLRDLGFLRGSVDDILSSGAVSMFMPHGVGHGLGLDVHDCEAFSSRTFDLSKWGEWLEKSTTCIFRPRWTFAVGTVLTNEPGLYFIPELIEKHRSAGDFADFVDYEKVKKYLDFGGVRIEDYFVISQYGAQRIGDGYKQIPRTISEIEDYIKNYK